MTSASARQLLLASLTGLFYPLCFPDYDQGWLALAVLVPLHLGLTDLSPQRGFCLGWLAGLIAFVGTMFWVVTAMHLYGKMPLLISYAVMLLLVAYLGLYVGLYAFLLAWLRQRLPALGFLPAPFLWVALELIRTYSLSGLPWALIGYSQYQWITAIQIADVTGVYGVSFFVVLVNVALSDLSLWILHRVSPVDGRCPWLSTAAAAFALAVVLSYGTFRLESSASDPVRPKPTIRIGLVQPNIDQAHKWEESFRRETTDRYARLTRQVAPGTDLIIWPEAATPFLFEQEISYRLEMAALVHDQGVPLLFGSPALRYYADGRQYLLNRAYLFSASGEILGRYDKQHLVPFGEYIPLRTLLFFLHKLVEGIGDFEAGTVPTVLRLPAAEGPQANRAGTKFGVVICFEVIFPNLVREFVRDGAEFMVTITNDAWFGNSIAPYQHFGMVVFRAVENRVAFARAANTGISGLIDPQGRILHATPIFTEGALQGAIQIGVSRTFYTRHGDLFAYGCVLITGILPLATLQFARR